MTVLGLLMANALQGAISLVWALGVRRFAGPLEPATWTNLLVAALVAPPAVALARAGGLPPPPDRLAILRIDLWAAALQAAGPGVVGVVLTLFAGSAVLTLAQEVWPAWRGRAGRLQAARVPDERLDAALARVYAACRRARVISDWGRPPRGLALSTDSAVAALEGFLRPTVLVSRGLLARLDDEELDAVVAHELAHLAWGGNARLLLLWAVRVVQLASPAALVLFRTLVESLERSCDDLAAGATGRPAALASALLKVHGRRPPLPPGATAIQRARAEVDRRADVAATRARVRSLLDFEPAGPRPRWQVAAFATLLGGFSWAIG